MRAAILLASVFLLAAFAGCLGGNDSSDGDGQGSGGSDGPGGTDGGDGDAGTTSGARSVVVIAVVDSGFNPYHWDFVGDHMPQHLNDDPSDDLPLWEDPSTWIPGFSPPDEFASYDRINVSVNPTTGTASPADMYNDDMDEWNKTTTSSLSEVHYRWLPGTKVVGYLNFGTGHGYAASSHGVGTSSVSVGNIHGSCPECVLVFINGLGEQANEWVESQSWIDAQTNSWGFSTGSRDRVYAGSDTELQRESSERGQTIFFSAGNGQANTFTAPNPTLFSSQEGPDWMVTVGAIEPSDGSSYSGHGKPADIAAPGGGYPSAGGQNVSANSTFGGTSNATPVTAGMYGKALYELRKMMGDTRRQIAGTISSGQQVGCGAANADCAIADGALTAQELREALYRGAVHTETGWTAAGSAGMPGTENEEELTFMAEGHGSYWGRLRGDENYTAEWSRIVGYAAGKWYEPQDEMLAMWMVADSYCRQSGWGNWAQGYFLDNVTELPPDDPDWPVRNWLVNECPVVLPAAIAAEKAKDRPGGE